MESSYSGILIHCQARGLHAFVILGPSLALSNPGQNYFRRLKVTVEYI